MEDDNYDIEIINKVLLSLVKEGRVVCNCYKCNLPISYKEVTKNICESCGPIEQDKILFRALALQNLS